jgi:nitronate monooxygenase
MRGPGCLAGAESPTISAAWEKVSTMPLPQSFHGLRVPVIAAPMFLVSGPDLVVETCRSGVIGTFPSLNQPTTEGFSAWLDEIVDRLSAFADPAPFGVNLIVHKSNERLNDDLAVVVRHRVPLVITSLGLARHVMEAVHSYGGVVFHDVISRRHAEKAVEAGVDGLIAVCAGAGGHTGNLNPFAFVSEIRRFFGGPLALSGSISTGRDVAAALLMGADLAYLGTRFIATREAMAPQAYKDMLVTSRAADVLYTNAVTGVSANFLKPSLAAAGLDPDRLPSREELQVRDEVRAWKTIWSAGHGVDAVDDVPAATDLCERLVDEYREAVLRAASDLPCVSGPSGALGLAV